MRTTSSTASGFRRKRTLDVDDARRALVDHAVMRAKAGDRDALQFLYVTFADNVYGYICSFLRDEHEAEDVTQHVFARLATSIQRYERRAMPFSAWILRVAHNAAIDHMRVRRGIPHDELPGGDQGSEDDALLWSLREALEQLPDEQRQVLVMRHVLGLSPGEIADRMAKSETAIHGLHHRGRRALRVQLTAMGAAPSVLAA
jgi:RNA polymerase sigma-70 factor (ECF subfamily)